MVLRLAVAHVGNKIDAEDIYQEVFVRLVNSIDKINDEDHLRFWLVRVTINRCKSLFTSSYRKRELHVEELPETGDAFFDEAMDTPATDALQNLPEKYRTPIHLFYFEDLSISEISQILDISEGAIKTQLSRGRKMLNESLRRASDV
jgi:RNA polymerase sigma-70 factor (ECF subfamily)